MNNFDDKKTIQLLQNEVERLRSMNQAKLDMIHDLQAEISELKVTHDDTEWFGKVRWCEEDLKEALRTQGYPVTENNVAKLYDRCSKHWFTDHMIEAGWEYMYCCIGDDGTWDTYKKQSKVDE